MSTTAELRPTPRSKAAFVILFALLISSIAGFAYRKTVAAAPAQQTAPAAESSSPVARGEYLATRVAMCVQCHSGRDAAGNILESEKFRGGRIPPNPPFPGKPWALRAPAIAGLPGFSDAQVITLLMEGRAGDRPGPRAPMPPFRMNRQDAEAIVAFLRSR